MQYHGLFGATRIPEKGKDHIYRTTTSSHICVMRNGHLYAVNVLDAEGNVISDFNNNLSKRLIIILCRNHSTIRYNQSP